MWETQLSNDERRLLAAIAHGDEGARRVLADLWQQGEDEPRGTLIHAQCDELDIAQHLIAAHGARWRKPLVDAGFYESTLEFHRGFLRPLVVGESPGAYRASAAIYLPVREVDGADRNDRGVVVHEAIRLTADGRDGRVALKMPRGTSWFPDANDTLDREYQIVRRFTSPHLPRLRDVAAARQGTALAFAWCGTSLAGLLKAARRAGRAPGEAVAIAIALQLCAALDTIHTMGIIHTGVRPDHVAIAEGQVTLCDFESASCELAAPPVAMRMATGIVKGQFKYLSPEQTRGLPVDASTDVFALALVVGETVAGIHPIAAGLTDYGTLEAIRGLTFTLPVMRSRLGAALRAVLVNAPRPRASAARFAHTLRELAAAAHLQVGPEVISDFARTVGAV